MNQEDLVLEQKYVVKLERETFWGLSHGIVNGTLRLYKSGIAFKTNDNWSDAIGNLGFGTSIKDVPDGLLMIPLEKIASAEKFLFQIIFTQCTLHINLKDGLILKFRMQPNQADRFAHAVNKLIAG